MSRAKEDNVESELQVAYRLWSRGDLTRARAEARRVLAGSPTEPVRERAQRLLRDTAPDPRALMAGVGAIVLVSVILLLIFAH
jgi:hypothetical protein